MKSKGWVSNPPLQANDMSVRLLGFLGGLRLGVLVISGGKLGLVFKALLDRLDDLD